MIPRPLEPGELAHLVAVARGRAPADLVVSGGRVINVYSEEVTRADLVVADGRVAFVGDGQPAVGSDTEVLEAEGAYVLPGYLEPHCHPWVLYNPDSFARAVVPWGNTGFVGELLNLQLVCDAPGMAEIYEALQAAPVRWWWAPRASGQSRQAIQQTFPLADLEALALLPDVTQLAEVTGWPEVLAGDEAILERLVLARRCGLRLDGHGAGATPPKVAALAAAGFTADHEATSAEEARVRLRNGYQVLLRHSSLRPDLERLVELVLDGRGVARLSLTSDGSNPAWVATEGLVDGLIRRVVAAGVPVPRAVALGSLNPATYLGLDAEVGGLAPGRWADFQVLADFDGRPPELVATAGKVLARQGKLVSPWPAWDWHRHRFRSAGVDRDLLADPDSYRSPCRPGQHVPTMRFVSAGIARAGQAVAGSDGRPEGAVLAVLFARAGSRRSWAWLADFAPGLDGLATTYTTSGGFLVIGRDAEAMAQAARAAFGEGGGIAVVEGERVVAHLPLEIAECMSARPLNEVVAAWRPVEAALRRAGYRFEELLACLCFITCDFLPDLRLVPDGLLEVKTGRILVPADSIPQA